jgi:hypothetical protein
VYCIEFYVKLWCVLGTVVRDISLFHIVVCLRERM